MDRAEKCLKFIVLALLALMCSFALTSRALADSATARRPHSADWVRIFDEPCAPEVLRHITQGNRGFFKRAAAQLGGKLYVACWAKRSDTQEIHIVYADGDQGDIEPAAFTVDTMI